MSHHGTRFLAGSILSIALSGLLTTTSWAQPDKLDDAIPKKDEKPDDAIPKKDEKPDDAIPKKDEKPDDAIPKKDEKPDQTIVKKLDELKTAVEKLQTSTSNIEKSQ